MLDILKFYVSSLEVWVGITIGMYVFLEGFASVVKAFSG